MADMPRPLPNQRNLHSTEAQDQLSSGSLVSTNLIKLLDIFVNRIGFVFMLWDVR